MRLPSAGAKQRHCDARSVARHGARMCGDESVPGSSKDVGQGQPRGKEERDVLDVNDLDDAITRRVEPYLSSLSRTIMRAAHDDDDPDFLV
ncbi:Hypothetical protein PFCIRM516_12870 [Propionibacterium freudenreichii]|uniref:Uncharacterized protein n=2 Tax=Propionibacterium freudenreichii TaxID=1744 RepID=D7GIG5_PROFC|nr:Hypothetical protein PFREUD_03530 [Propionibacterium freudenreichii subsp. shermanii CIRM-BIA1]CDP49061.1 Hypothetical protein PFCIRM129_06550 [Propionibacterium freudenreichii subsp. freudenreichii]CEG86687.1 Hypothetical protein PFCIRM118_07700 [Propionibacterium freudenreichii]CEH09254.1 Hypothetical protein PFCIRM135_03090 [Propionibacterium freudenreichii]CEI24610.1 Hypothetical protein PFCIRM508_01070 [Propionibacterium freudenreichii]